MAALVHMIGEMPMKLKLDKTVQTRCGLWAIPTSAEPPLYTLTNETGGDFKGTTIKSNVTCRKCKNLITIGTTHARPAITCRPADSAPRRTLEAGARAVRQA